MQGCRRTLNLAALAALAVAAAGCAKKHLRLTDPDVRAMRATDRVYLVQGVSGALMIGMDSLSRGLRDAGVPCEVAVHAWHAGRPSFLVVASDQEYEYVERGADSLASEIEHWLRDHPDGRVHIVAQSAGTEVTRLALELLHPDASVETVVFLGCAFSPKRNLGPALRGIDGKLYNIHSGMDWPLLVVGAALTGTTDRRWSVAAGFSGFRVPVTAPLADRLQYRLKLVQIDWDGELAHFGHNGGHTDGMAYKFARYYLSHLIAGLAPPAGRVRSGFQL